MSPSAISNSVVALLACGVGGSAAFAPPSIFLPSPRRHAGAMASAAASDLDVGESSSSSSSEGFTSAKKIPLSPLSSPSPSSLPYIRIQKRGRHYDVQTAVTTFQKRARPDNDHIMGEPAATVDLHAQIHFGDTAYFEHFNDDAFGSQYDTVLYELIVEDRFLSDTDAPGLRQLTPASRGSALNPIAPTQADRATAAQYGLQCQVDGIQYCREGWVHADLTREEFLGWLKSGEQQKQKAPSQSANSQQPLWALASTAATYPGAELVTSLLRPLTTTSNSASAALTRRLFTHLFLPGDALTGWIRAALWLGVPSPELSILLVDWSSLSHIITRGRRRGGKGDDESKNVAPISPITAPVLLSLLTGNWGTARRLVFGEVLVGGQSGEDSSKGGVLIDKRNERAMEVLKQSLDGGEEGKQRRVALLYGAGHCRDLHRRLQEEGLTPVRTEWRTAFRATAPRWGDFVGTDLKERSRDIASTLPAMVDGENIVKSMSVSTLESVAVGLVILPLYLLVGGLDWVSTMGDLGTAVDGGRYLDGVASVLLYLLRHVALYVGISKFVVDWGGSDGVFEEE